MSLTPKSDSLASLIESAAAVVGEIELDTVLRRLVKEARASTGAEYAALGVIGPHGVLIEFIHEGLTSSQADSIGHPPRGKGLLGTVIRSNSTIRVDTIADHPDSYGFPPNHPEMDSFLGVPVSAGAEAFGNLYLTNKEGGFTEADVVRVEALSRIAGAAVHTARLQDRLRRVAVVEDRQRIARDLHDSVIQDLFAVGLGLQSLAQRVEDSGAASVLDQSVDRLDNAVEELRRYIFQLKEPPISPDSLDNVLQELVSRMGSAYPSNVILDVAIDAALPHLIEEEIVKIITEGLSNALRHADARNVVVEVEIEKGTWRLRVEDDGSGFSVKKKSRGMGLHNMKTRATNVGGTFKLKSKEGRGTVVSASGSVG